MARAGVDRLRRKSMALADLFIHLVEQECAGHGVVLASPVDAARRGSQVSLRHPEGHAIVRALVARGVGGDFRVPDILRFGLAPAYLRFLDVWDAAAALRAVLDGREWDLPLGHLNRISRFMRLGGEACDRLEWCNGKMRRLLGYSTPRRARGF